MLSEVIQKAEMMRDYLWEIILRIAVVVQNIYEIIGTIGGVVFIISVPIGFSIAMYESYHPEYLKKMQDLCERHNKIFISLILVYVLLSLAGISYVIANK